MYSSFFFYVILTIQEQNFVFKIVLSQQLQQKNVSKTSILSDIVNAMMHVKIMVVKIKNYFLYTLN